MSSIALIGVVVILEARPVYNYLSAIRCLGLPATEMTCRGIDTTVDVSQMVIGFGLAAVLCGAGTLLPIRIALRKLEGS
jgi:hypothetical protein